MHTPWHVFYLSHCAFTSKQTHQCSSSTEKNGQYKRAREKPYWVAKTRKYPTVGPAAGGGQAPQIPSWLGWVRCPPQAPHTRSYPFGPPAFALWALQQPSTLHVHRRYWRIEGDWRICRMKAAGTIINLKNSTWKPEKRKQVKKVRWIKLR